MEKPRARPYHQSGLIKLRGLLKVFEKFRSANVAQESFRTQVELATSTNIPKNHKAWRQTIRKGAAIFGQTGRVYVEAAIVKLLAEEKAARKKRADKLAEDMKKKAEAAAGAVVAEAMVGPEALSAAIARAPHDQGKSAVINHG